MQADGQSLREQVRTAQQSLFQNDLDKAIKTRSQLLKELFEVGIVSRHKVDPTKPVNVCAEQIRREMEYLASDLEPHLPNLPWKFKKTHSRINNLADFCNTLAAHYTLFDKKVQENLEYELLRQKMKDS